MGERTDNGPVLGSGFIHLFATIVLGLGIFLCWRLVKDPLTRNVALVAFGLSVLPWAINGFRFYRLRKALGTADLQLDDPIPLGFSGTATYYRPLNGAELRSIEARLQCEEEITKGSGKSKKQVTKIVHDEPIALMVTPMMTRIEVRVPVRIPKEGPPTYSLEFAKTTWWLRLRLKMSGCPNTASSFQIQVLPAVEQR